MIFEEGAGPVAVTILRGADGQPSGAELEAPHSLSLGDGLPSDTLADCVGLDPSDVRTEAHHPLVAGVGLGFIIAELTDREALARARPDPSAFREAAERFPHLADHFAVHLYARDPDDPTRLATRMFSPLGGIAEDPATGSANAALAALLVSLAPGEDVTLGFDIVQGVEMGRPSRLFARGEQDGRRCGAGAHRRQLRAGDARRRGALRGASHEQFDQSADRPRVAPERRAGGGQFPARNRAGAGTGGRGGAAAHHLAVARAVHVLADARREILRPARGARRGDGGCHGRRGRGVAP